MEESKMLSYSEFRDFLCQNLKNYFHAPRLKKNNIVVKVTESPDAYDELIERIYLYDYKRPDLKAPTYERSVSYETYCRSGDAEKVIKMLAELMERQYPEENTVPTLEEERYISVVFELEGVPEQEVSSIYLITEQDGKCGPDRLLQDDETLAQLATKEQSNLQTISISEEVLLAVPVRSMEEYEENLQLMDDLKKIDQRLGSESRVYDKDRNTFVTDIGDIKDLLTQGSVPKKGFFVRRGQ